VKRSEIMFGPFRLDQKNALLWKEGERIVLPPKPFEVLSFLTARPGELVTKNELISAIWPDVHVSDGSLTVAINTLRTALGEDRGSRQYIETVSRRGYRFVASVLSEQTMINATTDSLLAVGVGVASQPSSSVDENATGDTLPGQHGANFGGKETTAARAPRLSIVVLPFSNLGGDLAQDYFVDGVTESLTTDLSRIVGAVVIARSTAFTYKGLSNDVRVVANDLNVRYVLEGSVQRTGKRMRVNV
jgi:DNA-binding winged helix-turn-helix (wHTH) protein